MRARSGRPSDSKTIDKTASAEPARPGCSRSGPLGLGDDAGDVRQADRAVGAGRLLRRPCSGCSCPAVMRRSSRSAGGADDRDPIARPRTARSRPGQTCDGRPVGRHDRDRGQVAEQAAQRAGGLDLAPAHRNCSPPSSSTCARWARQASTKAGAARVATSSTLSRPGHPGDGPPDRLVGQLDDDPQLGPQPAGQQGDLQVAQVVGVDADQRARARRARRCSAWPARCALAAR